MSETDFLQASFLKALNKPKTALFKDHILCYRNSQSGFVFADKSACGLAPCFLKTAEIEELAAKFKHDSKRGKSFKSELDTFYHYYGENIIVEENSKKSAELRQKLGLYSLSRQAAQLKCVIAALIPSDFEKKNAEITQKFANYLAQAEKCFAENPKDTQAVKISDFSFNYNRLINKVHLLDLFCPSNKKILKERLCEIIETLIDNRNLAAGFADGEIFNKPIFSGKKGEKYCAAYRGYLLYLSEKILVMRNNSELLKLALMAIKNQKNFAEEMRFFKNSHSTSKFDDIVKIRKSVQKLYEKFAKIAYLNAVRSGFEHFYIFDNPNKQNSPLPSVAPQEEMKTIQKIAEKSYEISAKKGKLGQEYNAAISEFNKAAGLLQQALDDYNHAAVHI